MAESLAGRAVFSLVGAQKGLVALFAVACRKRLNQHLQESRKVLKERALYFRVRREWMPHYPLSQPSQPPLARRKWLPNKRKVKINKASNKQGAVRRAHQISIEARALFAPYLLGRERKRSIV